VPTFEQQRRVSPSRSPKIWSWPPVCGISIERLTPAHREIVNPRGSVGGVSWQSNYPGELEGRRPGQQQDPDSVCISPSTGLLGGRGMRWSRSSDPPPDYGWSQDRPDAHETCCLLPKRGRQVAHRGIGSGAARHPAYYLNMARTRIASGSRSVVASSGSRPSR